MDFKSGLNEKYSKLIGILEKYDKICVAYSGGIDSTLLSFIAKNVIKRKPLIITVNSAFLSKYELDEASKIANLLEFNHTIIYVDILNNQPVVDNDVLRCKYCKKYIMTNITEYANKQDIYNIFDGSNIDDLNDYRPGFESIKELEIHSPFIEAGINKYDIMTLGDYFNLPNKNKPASACLATRIPYNTAITKEILDQIEKSEDCIRNLGYSGFRVRYHDKIAKIELIPDDIANFITNHEERVGIDFKKLGYTTVCVDLKGYRPAGLNK